MIKPTETETEYEKKIDGSKCWQPYMKQRPTCFFPTVQIWWSTKLRPPIQKFCEKTICKTISRTLLILRDTQVCFAGFPTLLSSDRKCAGSPSISVSKFLNHLILFPVGAVSIVNVTMVYVKGATEVDRQLFHTSSASVSSVSFAALPSAT